MRVLMFGWEFTPFKAGGLATATLGLVNGLVGRGVDVTLVVPFPAGAAELPGLNVSAPPFAAHRPLRLGVWLLMRLDKSLGGVKIQHTC